MSKDILIGWANRDITPDKPVSLQGQFYMRNSRGIHDRLSVTAWAIESEGEQAFWFPVIWLK